MREKHFKGRDVYIVDGKRTPFLKSKGKPGPFSASDLGVCAARSLLQALPIEATDIQESIWGCVNPSERETNIARIIAYRLGCGKKTPAYSVQRNCASGMQAIDEGLKDIAMGRHDLLLVGGTEAMSRAPLIYNKDAVNWFSTMASLKSPLQKIAHLFKWRPSMFFDPVIGLVEGLTDPMVCLSMGQTAENVAHDFKISREAMDRFSQNSHQRAGQAMQVGDFKEEMVNLYDGKGQLYDADTGVRSDASLEKLATLKAFFDKKFGAVTAGNSSQITDGATALVLASGEAVKKYKLPVLGRILDVNWAGLDPALMGLGPIYAATPMLLRNQLTLKDIDYWEINEAFAAQVLGCLKGWESDVFCKQEFGLEAALGSIDPARLNVDGGAIAMGHPVGASGARIVLHLLNVLKRKEAALGIAALCIGGGLGGAMLLERCEEVAL